MLRARVALFAGLCSLVLTASAAGKAPPAGISVCGSNACTQLDFAHAEGLFTSAIFSGSATRPTGPAPYYELRWSWDQGNDVTAYWVPDGSTIRMSESSYASWHSVDAAATAMLGDAARGLTPFAVPTITRVTVGGRLVADPQSYLRLFQPMKAAFTWPAAKGWLRVRLAGDRFTPWTDGLTDLRISKAKNFVWFDYSVYRVPSTLARRARRALSLTP